MNRRSRPQPGQGSRYLYEPFDSAHARIETHERVFEERWAALSRVLEQIETGLDRLERRLWIAVYSIAVALVAQFIALACTGQILP